MKLVSGKAKTGLQSVVSHFNRKVNPMMLREIQAFQACWLDLQDIYPTSREDNTLIAQAMGQLVDGYQKPELIEAALPEFLQILFRRLALAYFQGYYPKSPLSSATPTGRSSDGDPPEENTQRQEIVAAIEDVRRLAQQSRARMSQSRNTQSQSQSFNEMDTLIIEIPAHWQATDES